MVKRVLLSLVLVSLLVVTPAYAGDYNVNQTTGFWGDNHINGNIHDSFNDTTNNIDNSVDSSIHNTATGGAGGEGGDATAYGGNATVKDSGNSTVNIGNVGIGKSFSPEATATIEKGAVTNNNANIGINSNKNYNTDVNINKNVGINKQGQIQGQAQKQKQNQLQGQSQSIKGSANNTAFNNQTIEDSREFAHPGSVHYAPMPQEYGKTDYANVMPLAEIFQFGCVYNKTHLENMKGDGRVETLELNNLYGNTVSFPEDTATITFLTAIPANMKLMRVGTVVSRAKGGSTTTEQVLGDMGLEALSIKGAKYVLVLGEGHQSKTSTNGWGVALGYTHAGISDNQQWSGTGTAGIGYSSGSAGRVTAPFLRGYVLTDEATFKELTK